MIREITGFGEGKGPYIAISDGLGRFTGITAWAGLFPNADRLAIDTHPYFAFSDTANPDPINVPAPDGKMGGTWPGLACTSWKSLMNDMYATINFSFLSGRLTGFSSAKRASVSVSPENTATVSTTVASI